MTKKLTACLVLCLCALAFTACNTTQDASQPQPDTSEVQQEQSSDNVLTDPVPGTNEDEPTDSLFEETPQINEEDMQVKVTFNDSGEENTLHATMTIAPKSETVDQCVVKVDQGNLNGSEKEVTLSKDDFLTGFTYDHQVDASQFNSDYYAQYVDKITIEYMEGGASVSTETVNFVCKNDETGAFISYYLDVE